MEPLTLAIDLGSTHFKAAIFNRVLEVVGQGGWRVEYRANSNGRVELEVAPVLAGFRAVVTDALGSAGVATSRLAAIAITSQAQTFTILDGEGRAKLPLISWQDSRAGDTCRALSASPEFADFAGHASFGALLPGLQLCQLAQLRDRQPDWIAAGDWVVPLPSLLVRELAGGLWIDENLAAMSGLYSRKRRAWWPPALTCCGLNSAQLPVVCPIGTAPLRTDRRAERLGLRAGIPIVLAGNDQTAGGYGARLHEREAILLTLGTAQVAYSLCEAPGRPAADQIVGPYPGGRHYRMAADLYGGNLIEWAGRQLPGLGAFESFFSSAAASATSDGICFQPDETEIRGKWSGVAVGQAPPGQLARAVLECLARRMAQMLDGLEGARKHPLLAAGGGNRFPVWLELLGRVLKRPITPIDGNPLAGAAAMALESASEPS